MSNPEAKLTAGTDEQRATLHAEFRRMLWEGQRYNVEQAEKTIVTVASGVLAVSVTLLKDVQSSAAWILVLAWIFFFIAIVSVFLSYWYGNRSIEKKLADATDYYDERKAEALHRNNPFEKRTWVCNVWAGITFLLGLLLMVVFVGMAFYRGELRVEEKENNVVSYAGKRITGLNTRSWPEGATRTEIASRPKSES